MLKCERNQCSVEIYMVSFRLGENFLIELWDFHPGVTCGTTPLIAGNTNRSGQVKYQWFSRAQPFIIRYGRLL